MIVLLLYKLSIEVVFGNFTWLSFDQNIIIYIVTIFVFMANIPLNFVTGFIEVSSTLEILPYCCRSFFIVLRMVAFPLPCIKK